MIPGVAVEVSRDAVWVRSREALEVLSSALVGADLVRTRHIVNMRVPNGYRAECPAEDLGAFARGLGITEPFVGLMTAASTHRAIPVTETADGLAVSAVVTVGLGSTVAAGVTPPAPWRPATINTIVVLDARLVPGAAVNGVVTATEAKVGALGDVRVMTADGCPATGTVTDAVVIAWTGRGPLLTYLGPAAPGGWLVARAVRRALRAGTMGA